VEELGLAVMALVLAVAVATWIYGIYCYVQMVRHRRAGVPMFSMMWPTAYLSERGRAFRRRALLSYAAFALLALLLILWGRCFPT
jgi:formate hydrogenlyase subunit 4